MDKNKKFYEILRKDDFAKFSVMQSYNEKRSIFKYRMRYIDGWSFVCHLPLLFSGSRTVNVAT